MSVKHEECMNTKLYLECASGISGDMTVAALLDLGADPVKLKAVLDSLELDGFRYEIIQKKSCGIAGIKFDVILSEHTHHTHSHHQDKPSHSHSHSKHHEHRNLMDVYAVIDRGNMSEKARALAKKIFQIVAEAESKAHGCPVADVHFHEVGAIDSIVDIVAVAACVDDLGITECIITSLCEGTGFVTCQHGRLPVPVPAVVNVAQAHAIALKNIDVDGELVTPTGIAIAAALQTTASLPETYRIINTGVGLGTRTYNHPNVLRAMLIEPVQKGDDIFLLETNIDDATGEELGFAMEKFLASGARDVYYTPCFMKKNRPGWILSVIADSEYVGPLEELIFEYTTTIGIRKSVIRRCCMSCTIHVIELPCGSVKVKKGIYKNITKIYPEYSSVKKLAEQHDRSFRSVYTDAVDAAKTALNES